MDVTRAIAAMKAEPGFSEKVGMILIHCGMVRGRSRKDGKHVQPIDVAVDAQKLKRLQKLYTKKPEIYKVLIECNEGRLQPGDDLLFIVVARDIRDHVKPVLSELLDLIKSEVVNKTEISV